MHIVGINRSPHQTRQSVESLALPRYLRHGIELAPGALVLDVGGNIGMFSRWAASACQGDVHILAFEPVLELAEALQFNLELAALEQPGVRSTVFRCGLADAEGATQFTFYPRCTMWSSAHEDMTDPDVLADALELVAQNIAAGQACGDQESPVPTPGLDELEADVRTVEMRRLSSVLRDCRTDGVLGGNQQIALLKVDVEGAELQVLLGIDEADWARLEQVVVEVHDRDGKLEAVAELLRFRGFAVKVERGPPPFYLVQRYADRVAPDGTGLQFSSSEMAHVFARRPHARV